PVRRPAYRGPRGPLPAERAAEASGGQEVTPALKAADTSNWEDDDGPTSGAAYTALHDAVLTHPTMAEGLDGLFSAVSARA
ncbi:MAG TPA: hypothetical protein VKE74_28195, partial [Gemmataceae bacterium]|nr:hypothetical protein [Gemmataceae bacterium]